MTNHRYAIVEGSQSAHCCFEATVVDTHQQEGTNPDGTPRFLAVCECFEREDAARILAALNDARQADAGRAECDTQAAEIESLRSEIQQLKTPNATRTAWMTAAINAAKEQQ